MMHASSSAPLRCLVASAALAGAGCYDFSLPDDPAQPTSSATTSSGDALPASSSVAASVSSGNEGGGSGAGTGGQGGTGGSEVCDGLADCDEPVACRTATCDGGVCGEATEAEGTACDLVDGGDGLCNATGTCVACLTVSNCPAPDECAVAACQAGACEAEFADDGTICDGGTCLLGSCDVEPLCINDVLDGPNETDVDCGGTCPRCINSLDCALGTDCQSGFCSGTTCAPCGSDADCPGSRFCDPDSVVCTDDLEPGAACDGESQCASGFCPDDVCCEAACNGVCESCGGTGSCEPIPDRICEECETSVECPADETCDDAGSCVVNRAVQVSVGTTFSCARDQEGRVHCWGANNGGQLGDGVGDGSAHPDPVLIALPGPAIDVAAGSDLFACAIVAGSPNQLYCWGANLLGNIGVSGNGIYSPTPVLVSALSPGPLDVELGDLFGCIATPSGPFCWGRNEQCAANPESSAESQTVPPDRVNWGSAPDRVIVGARFACVTPDSEPSGPFCWGANADGQQGTSSTERVCSLGHAPFDLQDVTTHLGNHSCAPSGGDVACWGSNTAGQVGLDPLGPDIPPPILVGILGEPVEIALGLSISCALSLGDWYCWGAAVPGFEPMSHVPTAQPGLEGLEGLSLGDDHGCGVETSTGYVYCFGNGDSGKTGNESVGSAPSRVVLPAP